jgi:hypothetical protein
MREKRILVAWEPLDWLRWEDRWIAYFYILLLLSLAVIFIWKVLE